MDRTREEAVAFVGGKIVPVGEAAFDLPGQAVEVLVFFQELLPEGRELCRKERVAEGGGGGAFGKKGAGAGEKFLNFGSERAAGKWGRWERRGVGEIQIEKKAQAGDRVEEALPGGDERGESSFLRSRAGSFAEGVLYFGGGEGGEPWQAETGEPVAGGWLIGRLQRMRRIRR